jgi:hypothetical protein
MILKDLMSSYMTKFFAVVFLILGIATSNAQPLKPGEWRTYTAMTNVADIAIDANSSRIWVGTNGGVYSVPMNGPTNVAVKAFRNSDGLSDNDITALALGANHDLYIGNRTGGIDILHPNGQIDNVKDIFLASQFPLKQILKIVTTDSLLYIATGFGMNIYNANRRFTLETISRFGTLANQDTVFDIAIANDSIYAVLSNAIAMAPRGSKSLTAPFTWHTITASDGINFRSIAAFKSQLLIGGPQGLFQRRGDTLISVAMSDSVSVIEMSVIGDSLFILDSRNGGRIVVTGDLQTFSYETIQTSSAQSDVTAFAIAKDHSRSAGYSTEGVTIGSSLGTTIGFAPDGPLSNEISDVHFAGPLRKVFAVYPRDGVTSFDPGTSLWTAYRAKNNPFPPATFRYAYYDTIRKKLWISARGGGVFEVTLDPVSVIQHASADGLIGRGQGSDFVITGRGLLDNHGDFVISQWAYNGAGFAKKQSGTPAFSSIQLTNLPGGPDHQYGSIVQDLDDTYFIATEQDGEIPPSYGVFAYFKDGTTIAIPGGTSETLSSPGVSSLLVDQDNGVWCGTLVGVEVLSHSQDFQTHQVTFHSRKLTFLDQQIVHAITVDGIGNKWVSTENGVFIVSKDGTDSLAHFTTANSPLISNSVKSIAIDDESGEAYIATDKGISRTSTIFAQGSTDYTKLYIYPNPLIQLGDDPVTMTIKGLVQGSTVKVYTVSGRLVSSIDATNLGGAVRWNCRDDNNKLLPSGVYVVSANSETAPESGQTKFVLVRK